MLYKQPNKYHNEKTVGADGTVFDSRKEERRYAELKLMERAGEISHLSRQQRVILIPNQLDKAGKVIERKAEYVADFLYITKDGKTVVEDVKSPATRTPVYRLKKKLMLYRFGIKVEEV